MGDYSPSPCECGECRRRLGDIEKALTFWQQRLYKAMTEMLLVVHQDLECGDIDAAQEDIRTFLELFAERSTLGYPVDFGVGGHA